LLKRKGKKRRLCWDGGDFVAMTNIAERMRIISTIPLGLSNLHTIILWQGKHSDT
jgi:hypothetical protein